VLEGPGKRIEGWTLNVSRGGVRIVLEEPVAAGAEYAVLIGEEPARRGRVVWVRDEADGQIAGIEFTDRDGESSPGTVPPSG
jgi:hypothetical protein